MKQEEFDQLIQAQFANDVVNPPAHVEEAVFHTLSVSTRKTKYFGWFISLVVVGFTSLAAWQLVNHPEPDDATNPSNAVPVLLDNTASVPIEGELKGQSNEDASLGLNERSNEAMDETEFILAVPQSTSKEDPSALTEGVQGRILAPESTLETISSRPVEAIESNELKNEPELEKEHEETWTLPAKVKVKH